MTLVVKRLGPGDESHLTFLAINDAEFDIAGRNVPLQAPDPDAGQLSMAEQDAPLQPLAPDAARRHLEHPAVLHWVAIEDDALIGHLYCILLPLWTGAERELLLYEVGVHQTWQRRGIGRLLLAAMEQWMRENDVAEVWVLADNPGAVAFYRACGFAADAAQPLYLTRRLDG